MYFSVDRRLLGCFGGLLRGSECVLVLLGFLGSCEGVLSVH